MDAYDLEKLKLQLLRAKSRQRKWQIQRVMAGCCESCGEERGEGRENKRRCKDCEKSKYKEMKSNRRKHVNE